MVDHHFSADQGELLASLDTPLKIQAFLDTLPYSVEHRNRCPVNVLADRVAHCLDGGLFAALALRQIGFAPRLIDLLPEPGTDDDHILAIYQIDGLFGAVAKSNFPELRFREPVYRSLRELVMSYFGFYFNIDGVKTLRGYTRPLDLASLDAYGWPWRDEAADMVEKRLAAKTRIPLFPEKTAALLSPVDELTYQAGTLHTNPTGVYRPNR
ncbi:MAG: hypothetical protein M1281_10280 [Chloroflexi bacterium]|nr:hypothetical protein [Chloroflexota bacterium]